MKIPCLKAFENAAGNTSVSKNLPHFLLFFSPRSVINTFKSQQNWALIQGWTRVVKEIPNSTSVLVAFCRAGLYAGLHHEVLIIAIQLWISLTGSSKKYY